MGLGYEVIKDAAKKHRFILHWFSHSVGLNLVRPKCISSEWLDMGIGHIKLLKLGI